MSQSYVAPARSRRAAVLAAGLTGALVLSACSSAGEEPSAEESPAPTVSSPTPSSTVGVPAGVELTEVGSDLEFGDTATVIYEPNKNRGTILDLTVQRVRKGRTKDFSGFILDDKVRASTPYYVNVTAKNVGEGTVGTANVPLWGVDGDNTLLPPATFTSTFKKCDTETLPKGFSPGDTLKTCLVYLAPDGGTLDAVSHRPNEDFDAIRWTGEIRTPAPTKGSKQSGKKKSQNKGSKKN